MAADRKARKAGQSTADPLADSGGRSRLSLPPTPGRVPGDGQRPGVAQVWVGVLGGKGGPQQPGASCGGEHRGTWPPGPLTKSCRYLSRSHLQPASYGPVLSPMNKAHGGVNKLPSVNQLVGQPPPHGSAAGPNLGPVGEWPGPWGRRAGRGGTRQGV